MSKQIPLTRGAFALVDNADYEWLSQYNWCCDLNGYAVRKILVVDEDGSKRFRKVMMHRFILDAPAGVDVDHANRDLLDNRRCNLRLATRSQNNANSPAKPGCSSPYKGVGWDKRKGRWRANIAVDGKRQYLGYFADEAEAARAYDRAAYAAWGEYAHLNFPKELRLPEPA